MTEPPSTKNPMARLQAAMSVYLAWRASGTSATKQTVLTQHADLADLLEPLFAEHDVGKEPGAAMRSLGDYQLVREIGRGGMGVVYEAVQMSLNRKVALKVLPAHLTLRPSAIARFQREATVAAKLTHPAIVPVFGVGSDGGAHFFAMELIEGVTLDRVLERARDVPDRSGATVADALRAAGGPPSASVEPWQGGWVATVVRLVIQIADALHYAHGSGVIHRDVKPANIFVRRDGSAVLGDFGLARDVDTQALTLTGDFAGTPNYVSPEQAQAGRVRLDHRSDVFSLGATLYECLTLQRAFSGPTVADVLARIIGREPIDPLRLQPDLAPDLAAIVLKALEKEPARRYQSAAELADDLRAFLEYRPVRARRTSAATRAWRWARREPWRAVALAGSALAVPALTALGGHALATKSAVDAGEKVLLRGRIERALQSGFVELGDKRPLSAEPYFAAALALEAGCPEAVAGVALARRATHGAVTALQVIDQSRAGAAHPELSLVRAHLLRAAGRDTEAADLEATLGPPSNAMALFLAGTLALERGESREALALLTRAILAAPQARLHFHGRRAQAAARAADAPAADDSARILTSLWPDSYEAWFTAALALAVREPEKATAAARRSIELAGDSRARARTNLGVLLLMTGDSAGAIATLREAVAENRTLTTAHFNLGVALLRAGQAPEATAVLAHLTTLDAANADAWRALGDAQQSQGDGDAAHASYARSVEAAPGSSDARLNFGLALRRTGDLDGALRELGQAVELDAGNAAAWGSYGNALLMTGDTAAGLAACKKSTELAPRRAEMWVGLGMALAESGDETAAVAAARRATELAPAMPQAHDMLCRILGAFGLEGELAAERTRWAGVQRDGGK